MKKKIIRRNPIIYMLLFAFVILSGILAMISCYFAYQQKKAELLMDLDKQMKLLANEYIDITDKNWQVYLTITETLENQILIDRYFTDVEEMNPRNMIKMKNLCSQMVLRNKRIKWIVVYTPEREKNYIYICDADKLMELPENFAYLEELRAKEHIREIYAAKKYTTGEYTFYNIAIAGGIYTGNVKNSILVGYDISGFENIGKDYKSISSLQFFIRGDGKVIYHSGYEAESWTDDFEPTKSGIYSLNGKKWMVQVTDEYLNGETIFYMVEWWELFWRASQWSRIILGIVFVAILLAVSMYWYALRSITNEVNAILDGLTVLGNNQLDYRIDKKFHQPEMNLIAEAVNQMAETLEDNIQRILTYERMQADAKFSELQAKFNPHFLYNTLDVFRSRCYQNGDEETANLIAETAAIFRCFIGEKNFITIMEELSMCKRYLAIYYARYGDTVRISYDIDTKVLQYGIIRNIFQPLIENYFEHGYDSATEDNYILIKGRLLDEDILFTVEDNGMGIGEDALAGLNESLNKPIVTEKESYGLRNLHQRLRMFYGEKYGLSLRQNGKKGFIIEILIKQKKV